jgi:hypothetical protein
LPPFVRAAAIWCGLALLAIYPPQRSRLRDVLVYAGPLLVVWALLLNITGVTVMFSGGAIPLLNSVASGNLSIVYVPLLFDILVAVQIVAAISSARGAYRTPVSWLGGMWLLAILIGLIPRAAKLAGSAFLLSHYGDAFNFVSVFCLAFGVAYPVLRHRMLDLNILITRAGVYAIVSAIIVGVFIGGEWALGKIFETSLGFSKGSGGLAAQISSLVLVLILGISARSIHRFVDERLTSTFFRKRMDGLATIERLAHEADSASDIHAYMNLAVKKIEQSLETIAAAFYVRDGNRYARSSCAGAEVFPPEYAFNDEAPLALRRWQKPFECEDTSEHRHHVLFLPMSVRGELVGFLAVAPKKDHTAFLSDETHALTLLADRAGISSVLLTTRFPASFLPRLAFEER